MTNNKNTGYSLKYLFVPSIIILLSLLVFSGFFLSMQNNNIYYNSLGLISKNYLRHDTDSDQSIVQVRKPFTNLEENNFLNWDAAIYFCIKEKGYSPEIGCYEKVRAAFFPAFPLAWRITGLSGRTICILNYLLFGAALAYLVFRLHSGSMNEKWMLFFLALTLPSTIIFGMPYTEAFFFFAFAIAFAGILKKKYWISFMGFFLVALIRPASVFLLLALLVTDFLLTLEYKTFNSFIKNSLKTIFPFAVGYFVAILIQHHDSGSWMSLFNAHSYWTGGLQLPHEIRDWSVEGFGMSMFSIAVVCIPSTFFVLKSVVNIIKNMKAQVISLTDSEYQSEYLFLLSTIYLSSMFLFILLFSGGDLHSFSRFTLNSPLFYVLLILYFNKIRSKTLMQKLFNAIVPLLLLTILLCMVEFGSDKFQFSYVGMFLLIISYIYFIFFPQINQSLAKALIILLFLGSIAWNAYLFNMYLSNAWIFA